MRPTIAMISVLGLAGCTSPGSGAEEVPPAAASSERDPALREEAAQERLGRLERVDGADAAPAVTGEVPEPLLARIRADAAARLGGEAESLEVVRAQAVTWSDGSLGCPQPDVVYTQALIPGYWVVLRAGAQQLDYRADEGGRFSVCETPATPSKKGLPR